MRIKKKITFLIIIAMVIIPFQTAYAETVYTLSTPSYVFQNTDGEFDIVNCDINLTQIYNTSSDLNIYGERRYFFAITEFGCGGLDIWSIQPPCYKNGSGNIVETFNDWGYMSSLVSPDMRVLISEKSEKTVIYSIPNNLRLTSNYMLSGSEFFPALTWPMVVNGNISVDIG